MLTGVVSGWFLLALVGCHAEAGGSGCLCDGMAKNWSLDDQSTLVEKDATVSNIPLTLGGGWYKFVFGEPSVAAPYNFIIKGGLHQYTAITIADGYCPGDGFDVLVNGTYLLTTPRVPAVKCNEMISDPDEAFLDSRFSSTKFMLSGSFNLTIVPIDSPYLRGTAFIRADYQHSICKNNIGSNSFMTSPLVNNRGAQSICEKYGVGLLGVKPGNVFSAARTMAACGYQLAWFGTLTLANMPKTNQCLALNATDPNNPDVAIVDCWSKLPVLCEAL